MPFSNDIAIISAIPYTAYGEPQESMVCPNNTTSGTLGAGEEFLGDWTDILRFSSVSILLNTDQPSATGGLVVEWSTDAVNIDDTDVFTTPANDGKFYTFPPEGRYIRIRYTNGATPQGHFRLQTVLRYTTIKPSSHQLTGSVSDSDDAELVKSILTGRDSTGTYHNLVVDSSTLRLLVESRISDGEGSGRQVAVDSSNRLLVASNSTIVPVGTTPVDISEISSLSGADDSVYVIPNGQTLTISRFAGGSEGNSGKKSKVSLYDDPNGNGTGMTLIRLMYLGGTNWEFSLDVEKIGDGTRAIRMRRERLDGGSDEVAGFWGGFLT